MSVIVKVPFSKQTVDFQTYLKDCSIIKNIPRNDSKYYSSKTNLALVYLYYG